MKIRPVWHCFEGLGHFFFFNKRNNYPIFLKRTKTVFYSYLQRKYNYHQKLCFKMENKNGSKSLGKISVKP